MTDSTDEAFNDLVNSKLPELRRYSDKHAEDVVVQLSQEDGENLTVYATPDEIDAAIKLLAAEIMSAEGKIPPSLYTLQAEPALYRIHVVTSAADLFTQWVLHEANELQLPAFMRNFQAFVMGCRQRKILEDD